MYGVSLTRRGRICAVLATLLAGTTGLLGQVIPPQRTDLLRPAPTSRPTVRAWSPAVAEALQAYRAGDLATAQAVCTRLLRESTDARVRFDAALVSTLCQLRGSTRDEWREGRAQFAQLAAEDATLPAEPECTLAYGAALLAMQETAAALDALDVAVSGYAAQGDDAHTLAALEELARAWAAHAEWEFTPARLGVTRPADPNEALATQRAQLEQVRARAAALKDSAATVRRIDLILGKRLLAGDATAAEGRRLLAGVADAPVGGDERVAAALILADDCVRRGEVAEATRRYEQVRTGGGRAEVSRAEDALQRLARPQVEIDVPSKVAVGTPVPLKLRVRGFARVAVEVRRVDLDAWLSGGPNRGNENALPETGSVQFAQEWVTQRDDPLAWWDSSAAARAVEFPAVAGGLVVIVRAQGGGQGEQVFKRLVVASDLDAACLVGTRDIAVWVSGTAARGDGTVKFWMRRSFVPVQAKLEGGVAILTLPNEARVMREREWLCLVRVGEQVALCRGQLEVEERSAVGRVLLLGGPPEVAPGDTLYLCGTLLDAPVTAGRELRVDITDATDDVLFTRTIPVSDGGAFALQVPITGPLGHKAMRTTVRLDGRVLENIGPRVITPVEPPETERYLIRTDWPAWQPEGEVALQGRVTVTDESGLPPQGEALYVSVQGWRLPGAEVPEWETPGDTVLRLVRLNAQGTLELNVPRTALGLKPGPAVLQTLLRVGHRDAQRAEALVERLVGPGARQGWLKHEPESAAVGMAVRFAVGWYEPGGTVVSTVPAVRVWRGNEQVAELAVGPTADGLRSARWVPTEPGAYRAEVRLPVHGADELCLSDEVVIGASPAATQPAADRVICRAEAACEQEQDGVRVDVQGRLAGAALVLVEEGEAVRGAAAAPLDGERSVFVPTRGAPTPAARVRVVTRRDDAIQTIADVPVARRGAEALRLEASGAEAAWPGAEVPVQVRAAGGATAPGTVLVARLVDARGEGTAEWEPQFARSGDAAQWTVDTVWPQWPGPVALAGAAGPEVATSRPIVPARRAPEPLSGVAAAVAQGRTLWCTSRDFAGGEAELHVALPTQPGVYVLELAALTGDGGGTTCRRVIDTRGGVAVYSHVPEWWCVGDRTILAVLLENGGAAPVDAKLRIAGGGGLHVESVRVAGATDGVLQRGADEAYMLSLPAQGRVWLYGEVEASRAGAAELVVDVSGAGQQRRVCRPYQVRAVEPAAGRPATTVRRTLTVWSPPAWDAEGQEFNPEYYEDAHAPQPYRWPRSLIRLRELRWTERPWTAGDRLARGELVQVREELVLEKPQASVLWLQPVPANCWAMPQAARDAPGLGAYDGVVDGQLSFHTPALQDGAYVHQYLLGVVRPGACELPAPQWQTKEGRVPLGAEPSETRLIVNAD